MLDNQNQDDATVNNEVSPKDIPCVVFFKPIIKEFAEGQQVIYMVISDKGKSIAVFDTIKACRHFAIRNHFRYEFAH